MIQEWVLEGPRLEGRDRGCGEELFKKRRE
jgi:hypothetical protein